MSDEKKITIDISGVKSLDGLNIKSARITDNMCPCPTNDNFLIAHTVLEIEKPTPPELDEELRDYLKFIEKEMCLKSVENCGKCPISSSECACGCADWILSGRANSKQISAVNKDKDRIIKRISEIKQQKKDAEIELERKRVVGKWCEVWELEQDRGMRLNIRKIKMIRAGFVDTVGFHHTYTTPLTPTQLTALGLEND